MTDDVLKADALRIQAMLAADETVLEDLLADDLTYTHTNCVVDSKVSLIGKLRDGSYDYRALDTYDVQVKHLSAECAVLAGAAEMTIHVAEESIVVPIRFTSVYIKHDGGWHLTAWQSTRQP